MKKRLLFCLAAVCCIMTVSPQANGKDDYPTKNLELVCPYGAGGSTSMGARIIAGTLSETIGRTVVVNNKPGAGGSIGAEYVAKAKPDGYTLFIHNSGSNGVTPAIRTVRYKNDDFDLFGQYAIQALGLVVKSDAPWKTVEELIQYAKQNPGALKYATSGIGTSGHFCMELFKATAGGLKIEHVPFKSGPEYIAALLGGHVQMGILYLVDIKGPLEAGKLRLLAPATEKRLEDYPDVPTFAEKGLPDVKMTAWYGISAPKGLPKDVSAKLKTSLEKTFQHPEVKKMLTQIGYVPVYKDAEEFSRFVKDEEKKLTKIAKDANIKID
ncbi:MAG TPA: tripartite tricarboxylate transporter substrate binding protein [Thermodesulfobacteriota bacterium]|nr:tripartite tricarboxylate transporter substrate binding protein [Thermodesulfobacteriota bacterium]